MPLKDSGPPADTYIVTTIRAKCPRCGEVELSAESILLNVSQSGDGGTYTFLCPSCEESVEKPADRRVVMLLRSAGVQISRESAPGGSEHPPLTLDDLIDFHFLLDRHDWFERLVASAR